MTRSWRSVISWVRFHLGLPRFCPIIWTKIISLVILFRLAVLGQLMPFANDSLSRVISFTMPGPPKPPVVHVTDVKDREVSITISHWVKIAFQTVCAVIGDFEVTWHVTINLFRESRPVRFLDRAIQTKIFSSSRNADCSFLFFSSIYYMMILSPKQRTPLRSCKVQC